MGICFFTMRLKAMTSDKNEYAHLKASNLDEGGRFLSSEDVRSLDKKFNRRRRRNNIDNSAGATTE